MENVKEYLEKIQYHTGIDYDLTNSAENEAVAVVPIYHGEFALALLQEKGDVIGIELLISDMELFERGKAIACSIQNLFPIMVNLRDVTKDELHILIDDRIVN